MLWGVEGSLPNYPAPTTARQSASRDGGSSQFLAQTCDEPWLPERCARRPEHEHELSLYRHVRRRQREKDYTKSITLRAKILEPTRIGARGEGTFESEATTVLRKVSKPPNHDPTSTKSLCLRIESRQPLGNEVGVYIVPDGQRLPEKHRSKGRLTCSVWAGNDQNHWSVRTQLRTPRIGRRRTLRISGRRKA